MYVVLHNFFTALKQKENKYFMNNNTGYYCYYLNVTKVFSNLVHILWLCRQLTQQWLLLLSYILLDDSFDLQNDLSPQTHHHLDCHQLVVAL